MDSRVLFSWMVILSASALFAASSSRNVQMGGLRNGGAAAARAAAGDEVEEGKVKLARLPQPRSSLIDAPEYNFNAKAPSRLSKNRQWALFEVEYQTSDKWMDNLAFTYHVILQGKDEETGKQVYNYFTTTIRYSDVPKGKHRSAAAIPPGQVERYGTPYALAVEVMGKGAEPLAVEYSGSISIKEWWKNDKVMSNPNVKVERRNGLIDRSKTPFALINPTDYEWVF